jgi:hypothetical protein
MSADNVSATSRRLCCDPRPFLQLRGGVRREETRRPSGKWSRPQDSARGSVGSTACRRRGATSRLVVTRACSDRNRRQYKWRLRDVAVRNTLGLEWPEWGRFCDVRGKSGGCPVADRRPRTRQGSARILTPRRPGKRRHRCSSRVQSGIDAEHLRCGLDLPTDTDGKVRYADPRPHHLGHLGSAQIVEPKLRADLELAGILAHLPREAGRVPCLGASASGSDGARSAPCR